jgi:hypothetical protein
MLQHLKWYTMHTFIPLWDMELFLGGNSSEVKKIFLLQKKTIRIIWEWNPGSRVGQYLQS